MQSHAIMDIIDITVIAVLLLLLIHPIIDSLKVSSSINGVIQTS